jgi:Queuosine biosynthesis protein QueC
MRGGERLILCGDVDRPAGSRTPAVALNLHGPSANLRLRIEDISRRLLTDVPDILVDLLDVAAYVCGADGVTYRGGLTDSRMGEHWRRKFRLVVPVRHPELWASSAVSTALVETLSFLSDDEFSFEFRPLAERSAVQNYFDFSDAGAAASSPAEVILFSGGLDSCAGAVEELAFPGRPIVLVSRRSASKIASAQSHLVGQLRDRMGAGRVLHIPVLATLADGLSEESTFRTRSFLFAALGAVVARLYNLDRIKIFENGIVSLNLPTVAQVVGARATRTTHPQALTGFRRLFSLLFGRAFDVVNPFIWLTKADIVARTVANGCSDLIRDTRSCTRVRDMTILHPHCGHCSQCIDRRFAVIAAGVEAQDPAEAYKIDLFTGERPPGPDREMALSYVRSASELKQLADVAFFARYGEASRAVKFFQEGANIAAGRIFDLHQRHAACVCSVFDQAVAAHAPALREGKLPPACLLTLVVSQSDTSLTYPERIHESAELPTIERDIRMAIDKQKRRVVFDRWGEITGAGAELLIALAGPFREATRNELAPENYPFTKAMRLAAQIECRSDETLRRRVRRCRSRIEALARKAGDLAPPIHAVIENIQWKGYRLNPDRVQIIALSELSQGSHEAATK